MKLNGINQLSGSSQVQAPRGLVARLARRLGIRSVAANGFRGGGQAGFSLQEVVMSMGLTAVIVAGAARAHVSAAARVEWSSCSFAAQNAAMQRGEQVRAARWDNLANPPVDQVASTNFLAQVIALEIPSIGTNVVYATNFTTISLLSLDPPVRAVRTDCVWRLPASGLFTNSHLVYRTPDQ